MQTKSNREVYLDLAKFFAMIMMVAGHSFFEFANPLTYDFKVFPWDWWNFARGKTAPMFLFLSGAVHVFANYRNSTESISNDLFFKRVRMSIVLIIIAYTLNSPINSFSEIFSIEPQKIENFLQVNILHIFGVGLLMLALVYKFGKNIHSVLVISSLLGIITMIVAPITVNHNLQFIPIGFRNYLNYYGNSLFTIFPYTSYLFFGTVFGILLKLYKMNKISLVQENFLNKLKSADLILLMAGIVLIFSGIGITKLFILNDLKFDMRSDIGVVIRNIGIITSVLFIAKKIEIKSNKFKNIITILSRRAIYIYVIHLFIIYGIGNIQGLKAYYHNAFKPFEAFLMSILVIFSTIIITLLVDKFLKNKIFIAILTSIIILYSINFMLQ